MSDKQLNEKERASLITLLTQGAPFSVIETVIPGITKNHLYYWKPRFEAEGWKFPPRKIGRPAARIPKPDTYNP